MARTNEDERGTLTIGELSKATQIPPETLRTWERRYGVPTPRARTSGGHRRYDIGQVSRLEAIARAIDVGYRPSDVARESVHELQMLVAQKREREELRRGADRDAPPGAQEMALRWVHAAKRLDQDRLEQSFERVWYTHGVRLFLEEYCGALLDELERHVRAGELEEHLARFARDRMQDYLISHWRGLSRGATGPMAACVLAPQVEHEVWLHAAAALMALSGLKIVMLGRLEDVRELDLFAGELPQAKAWVFVGDGAQAPRDTSLTLAIHRLSSTHPDAERITLGRARLPRTTQHMPDLAALGRWAPHFFLSTRPMHT